MDSVHRASCSLPVLWISTQPGYSPSALTNLERDAPSPKWPVRYRTIVPRLAVSLLIAGGFVWALNKGGLPLLPPAAALQQLHAGPVAIYVSTCLVAMLVRNYRWNYLLRPINPQLSGARVLGIASIGLAALLYAPMRMGEIVRPWLLAQDREVSFVHAAATVVAERIVDGLMLATMLAVSLWLATPLSPLPDQVGNLQLPVALVPAIAVSAFTTFFSAFVAMLLFYFWRDTARKLVFKVVGAVSKPLAGWLTQQIERMADSLKFLFDKRHGGPFLLYTFGYWGLTPLGLWVLLRDAGAQADLAQTCVVIGVLGLSTLLPSGPGFFGTYQLGVYCGLAMYFPAEIVLGPGAVFTFVTFTTQLVLGAALGVLGLWLLSATSPGPALEAPTRAPD